MLDREPFLKAIFADPDNDLPRLVFADFLEEHGDPAWAEVIRLQCQRAASGNEHPTAREQELLGQVFGGNSSEEGLPASRRGFLAPDTLSVAADELLDAEGFRVRAVTESPEWYGATRLKITAGRIVTTAPLVTILTSPVTEHVTHLDLSGREVEIPHDVEGVRIFDVELKPVITVRMVEALAQMREVRRLTSLDLRNNDLDNDALYALAKSPYFIRLERLALSTGNRFRGRVWRQVLERFGPDVVE